MSFAYMSSAIFGFDIFVVVSEFGATEESLIELNLACAGALLECVKLSSLELG